MISFSDIFKEEDSHSFCMRDFFDFKRKAFNTAAATKNSEIIIMNRKNKPLVKYFSKQFSVYIEFNIVNIIKNSMFFVESRTVLIFPKIPE